MVKFIDDHRDAHGVEPICDMLPIAPATYYDHLAKRADPARLSDRASAFSMRTGRSTARARSGGSCAVKGLTLRDASLPG